MRATVGISDERLAHFQARVVQDAIAEATATHWRRRAATFDRVGTERCDEIAIACRNHATIASVDVEAELEDQVELVTAEFWAAVDPTGDGRARIALHRAGGQGVAA